MTISSLRFLVAEDHDFQRNALVSVLKRLGATTIHEAGDGHAALAIIRDPLRPVDIVISDLDMPAMDGMEFLRHLGEAATGSAHAAGVSIILVSALERKLLTSVATMSEAYGIKLLGILEKPLSIDRLEPLILLHRPALPIDGIATSNKPEDMAKETSVFSMQEISTALQQNQFEPWFQPKVELSTGQVKGIEALARWRHPQQGIVLPESFISLLEHGSETHALMDELTWIMLKKAAAYCGRWRSTGLNATVSVNLSIKSLLDMQLAERVTDLVGRQSLEPRHVVLELTESALTSDVGKVLENLARLRMKGFGLSIDDYGTGYSSMQQLARIAFTELKIDQSFVTNASRQPEDRVILESSLDMARKLGITSVAEGVETREAYELLLQLQCDMVQGFFVARPMPYPDLLAWVRGRQPSQPAMP